MKITSTISYEGNLSTTITHIRSGKWIQTDAPVDNNGKGQSFSPTDLVASALGSCMLTIMGISSKKHNFSLQQVDIEVIKSMQSNPRRIGRVDVFLKIRKEKDWNDKTQRVLELAAINCPVAKSLHPQLIQEVKFEFYS